MVARIKDKAFSGFFWHPRFLLAAGREILKTKNGPSPRPVSGRYKKTNIFARPYAGITQSGLNPPNRFNGLRNFKRVPLSASARKHPGSYDLLLIFYPFFVKRTRAKRSKSPCRIMTCVVIVTCEPGPAGYEPRWPKGPGRPARRPGRGHRRSRRHSRLPGLPPWKRRNPQSRDRKP